MCDCPTCSALPPHPSFPGKHLDPKTGASPPHEWGPATRQGWVSHERFGSGQVIKRANRNSGAQKAYKKKSL